MQFGFRKNRSTEHAILELTDKISKAIDEGKYTLGIFLDLSKALISRNSHKKTEEYRSTMVYKLFTGKNSNGQI
jgi:hypothetical protein